MAKQDRFFFRTKVLRWGVVSLILWATLMGLFERVELITLDLRYRLSSSLPDSNIVLVVIDKKSLKAFPQWPWPRSYYAEVITSLKAGGARVIGLDLDFSSSSTAVEDQRLVDAVSEAGNVVLSAFYEDKILAGGLKLHSSSLPFEALTQVAAGIGSIVFPVDVDGAIRRAKWQDTIQGETMLSLAGEMARQFSSRAQETGSLIDPGRFEGPNSPLNLQLDESFYVNFIGPEEGYDTISFADVLNKQVSLDRFQNKLVLIGATAIELRDIWVSPFGLSSGVEIQAATLQTVRGRKQIHRYPVWWMFVVIVAAALFAELCLFLFSTKRLFKNEAPFVGFSGGILLACLSYALVSAAIFLKWGLVVDVVPVLVTLLSHYLFCSYDLHVLSSRSIQAKSLSLSALHAVGSFSVKEQPLDQSLTFMFEMLKELLSIRFLVVNLFDTQEEKWGEHFIRGLGRHDGSRCSLSTECEAWLKKTYAQKDALLVSNLSVMLHDTKLSGEGGADKTGIRSSLFLPLITRDQQLGVLHLHSVRANPFDDESVKLLYTMTNQLAMTIENANLVTEVSQLLNSSIEAFSSALELRDNETEGHSQRVAAYALEVGKLIQLDDKQLEALRQGALLHDIGKIGVPDAILRKPAALDHHEMDVMKHHPEYGYHMLKNARFPEEVARILLHHHEQYDGSGYPGHLVGDQIIIYSRIFMVVDAYDAICSNRPYRKGASYEVAMDEIFRCSGTQFDPSVVEAFLKISKEQLTEIRYKVDERAKGVGLTQFIASSRESERPPEAA